jgi:hypothetical protein
MFKVLVEKDQKLCFLPDGSHSQELNRISTFWHKVKYVLMAFKKRNVTTLKKMSAKSWTVFGGV